MENKENWAITQEWDSSNLDSYLLFDSWPAYNAWRVLAGFDYLSQEEVDEYGRDCPKEFLDPHFSATAGYSASTEPYKTLGIGELYAQYKQKAHEDAYRLKIVWRNGNLDDCANHTPAFFIEWALTKNFRPDWLDWAIERGLYTPEKVEGVIRKIDLIDLISLTKIIAKQQSMVIGEAFDYIYSILKKNFDRTKLFDTSSTTLPQVIEDADSILSEVWNTNWWRDEKLEATSFNAFAPSINEVAILKTDASKYFNVPFDVVDRYLHTSKQETGETTQPKASQSAHSDAQPSKWRKAFEYESEGLNALYELIESHYFDASGNPIYDPAQLPLKKNLPSEWLTGRTKIEADTIITSGSRKGKADK